MGQENIFLGLGVILSVALLSGGHQGLPPGVNPQHYQAVHQVPQMQQVPVQHHPQQGVPMQQQPQMHIQQQQQMHVPQQQMHMQQPQMQMQPGQPQMQHVQPQMQHVQPQMQHVQPQMQHGQPHMQPAHGHHGQPQVLNVANIQQEKEHIAEHMAVPIDTSKMTEQELQFHYFKMHDADNNNKLDGCELIKSLIHWHAEQGHINEASGQKPAQPKSFKDEELVNLIDPILSLDDTNSDGFIDYPEFVRSQQKAAAHGGKR